MSLGLGTDVSKLRQAAREKEMALPRLPIKGMAPAPAVSRSARASDIWAAEPALDESVVDTARSAPAPGLGLSANPTKTRWLDFAGKVLRFYAYFTEPVLQSRVESERVRKCVVYYYMENDTIQIVEPRVENSGIAGGTFVGRSRLTNPKTGAAFKPEDLAIGTDVDLYGRVLRVYDCDAFTRELYGQPPAEAPPKDAWCGQHKKDRARVHGVKKREAAPRDALRSPRLPGDDDDGVLCYTGILDDRHAENGRIHKYRLSFFLEDDTVELKEELHPGAKKPSKATSVTGIDGKALPAPAATRVARSHFAVVLKRQRFLKGRIATVDNIGERTIEPGGDYITAEDCHIGATHTINSRDVTLVECDAYTADWWARRGVDERARMAASDPLPVVSMSEMTALPGAQSVMAAVEAMGVEFGANGAPLPRPKGGDSISAKRERFRKSSALAGKTLRFSACRVDQVDEQPSARLNYVISYFASDDTLQVYAHAPHNSGLYGGLVLKKGGQLTNPTTKKPYRPKDFLVGKLLELPNAKLQVLAMDAYTASYLAGKKSASTPAHVIDTFLVLQQKIKSTGSLHQWFLEFDRERKGVVTEDEWKIEMNMLFNEFVLSDEEMTELFKFFDLEGKGALTFDEFAKAIDTPYAPGLSAVLEFDVNAPMSDGQIEKYCQNVHLIELTGKQELHLDRATRQVTDFVDKPIDAWCAEFAKADPIDETTGLPTGLVTNNDFAEVLNERARITTRDVDVIKAKLLPHKTSVVHYVNFHKIITKFMEQKKSGLSLVQPSSSKRLCEPAM